MACLGAFMATLDTSIVNIVLPQMAYDFQASLEAIAWVIAAYLLANASLLITIGRLGDLLPPGRLFLLGMSLFTGASALCGVSPQLHWIVAGRTLQGLGASLMLGVAPKLIATAYPVGERGLALGLLSTAFASGISVGAPLGGLITAHLGWRYVFFLNVPLCGLALLLGSRALKALPGDRHWDRRAFDLGGSVALAATLSLLLLSLTRIRHHGWGDPWTVGMLVAAGGLFGLLLALERRQAAPLLHPDLWRTRPFVLGSLAVVLAFATVMGTFFLLPFLLDQVYHYTPGQAGLLLAILSVSNAAVSPVGGYLADRWGNMLVLRTGSGLILLGLISLGLTGPETSTPGLAARFVLTGVGFGLFQAPNLNEILRGVGPSLVGLASSTNSALKNLGALSGITLMVTVFAGAGLHHLHLNPETCLGLSCFQRAFTLAAGVAALNLLVNLVPRRGMVSSKQ